MQKSVKFGEKWVFYADFMESDIYVLQKTQAPLFLDSLCFNSRRRNIQR